MRKKFNKLLSGLICFALVASIAPTATAATNSSRTGTCGDNLTWSLSSDGTLTVSGQGRMWNYGWFSPASYSNLYADDITKVVIQDGVTSIGNYAFLGLENMTEAVISDTVTSIGEGAFTATGLVNIDLGNSVKSIGSAAFKECYNLESVVLPDSLTNLDAGAFYECLRLTSVTIPSSLTVIEPSTFHSCLSLKEVVLPDTVTSIGDYAFMWCDALTDVTIGSSVSSIGEGAFFWCFCLNTIDFLGDASSIAADAFDQVTATVSYPAGNSSWTADVKKDYGGTLTWSPWGENTEATPDESTEVIPDTSTGDLSLSHKFTDINHNAWYCEAVEFVLEKGIMTGTGENTFAPNENTTRASVVMMLWNMASKPGHHITTNPFNDVKEGFWYTDAIFWAYENGIVSGNGAGGFSPNATISREQLAVMLSGFSAAIGCSPEPVKDVDLASYPDNSNISSWARTSLKWACDLGLLSGRLENGIAYLAPKGTATRAEVAVIFSRFHPMAEKALSEMDWEENNSSDESENLNEDELSFYREAASWAAYYINQYRAAGGAGELTALPVQTLVAEYRADQLVENYAHDTTDIREANAFYQYGEWIDATQFGDDPSKSYYSGQFAEAIYRTTVLNTNAESLGKSIADTFHNSSGHWSYVGSDEMLYVGIGVTYEPASSPYCVFACVIVSPVDYG